MLKRISQKIGGTGSPPAMLLMLVFVTGIVSAGCAGPRTYIHPNPEALDAVRKVVVMPFGNLSADTNAGEKVRISFVIELLRTGGFDVIDIGEADRLLKIASLSYEASTVPAIGISRGGGATSAAVEEDASVPLSKKIGEQLKVQAILAGSVDTYSSERSRDESVPEVAVSARLIDAETGIIIWASTHTRRGSPGIPIVGWRKMTSMNLVSRQVVQDMAKDLAKYIYAE